MKTLKKLSTVLFVVLFFVALNTAFAQANKDENKSIDTYALYFDSIVQNANAINTSQKANLASESRYFKSINAMITVTVDKDKRKLVSIEDSSKTLSEEFLNGILMEVNASSAASFNNVTAFGCGCSWWDVVCQAYCALCEGLTGDDCFFQ